MEAISDSDFFDKVLCNNDLSVVFFTSGWCGPCRTMRKHLEEISAKYPKHSKFFEIDTDDNFDAAMEFNVRSIPSTLLFRNGKVVSEIVGAVPQSIVTDQISKHTASI
jgi:thioredoxin 1